MIVAWLLWRQLAAQIPPPPDGDSVDGRLGLALAWLLPAMAVLWAMLLAQMGARFVAGAFDPLAGRDGRFLAVNQRVITNTVEHVTVFAPALLALAAGSDRTRMPAVLALGWCLPWPVWRSGRATWWRRSAAASAWRRRWRQPRARWAGRWPSGASPEAG